jgi:hypothetical protein
MGLILAGVVLLIGGGVAAFIFLHGREPSITESLSSDDGGPVKIMDAIPELTTFTENLAYEVAVTDDVPSEFHLMDPTESLNRARDLVMQFL